MNHKPEAGNVKIENRKFEYRKEQVKDNTYKVFSSMHGLNIEINLCVESCMKWVPVLQLDNFYNQDLSLFK
jgi:hypothetical protein